MSVQSIVAKISYDNDVRRVDVTTCTTFAAFKELIVRVFNTLQSNEFIVKYVDEENELCTISSDCEWTEARNLTIQHNLSAIKIFINSVNKQELKKQESKPIPVNEVKSSPPPSSTSTQKPAPPPSSPNTTKPESKSDCKGNQTNNNNGCCVNSVTCVKTIISVLQDQKFASEIGGVLSSIVNGLPVNDETEAQALIQKSLSLSSYIATHPVVNKFVGKLQCGVLCCSSYLKKSSCAQPCLDLVKTTLLPTLLPILPQLLSISADSLRAALQQVETENPDIINNIGFCHLVKLLKPKLTVTLLPQIMTVLAQNNINICELFAKLGSGGFGCGLSCDDEDYDDIYEKCNEQPGQQQQQATATTSSNEKSSDGKTIHSRVQCDGCGQFPIAGVRFKCTVCNDFDLCEACEQKGTHPNTHPLIKMRVVNGVVAHHGVECDMCHVHPIIGDRFKCTVCYNYDLCSKCESKNVHPQDHALIKLRVPSSSTTTTRPFSSGPCGGGGGGGGGYGSGWVPPRFRRFGPPFGYPPVFPPPHAFMNQSTPPPFATGGPACPWMNRGGYGGCGRTRWQPVNCPRNSREQCNKETKQCHRRRGVVFIKDVNYQDGSIVPPNQQLTKTWQIRNNSDVPFPNGSKLIFIRGDRELSVEEEYPVNIAKPGETIDIDAIIKTPTKPGRYTAYYQLSDSDRNRFGPRVWVDVTVGEEKSAEIKSDPIVPTTTTTTTTIQSPVVPPVAVTSPRTTAPTTPTTSPTPISLASPVTEKKEEKKSEDDKAAERYADHLNALKNMGFDKTQLNIYLLRQFDGKLQSVVEALLSSSTRTQ